MSKLYGKLSIEQSYIKHTSSLFKVMRKFSDFVNKEKREKYISKHCDNHTKLGIKWQMNVVTKQCYYGNDRQKFYQYTIIDETSHEGFIYQSKEQSSYLNVYFTKRAILYFGYQPKNVQNDNGLEFIYTKKMIKHIFFIFY